MTSELVFSILPGKEARSYSQDIAALRLSVFFDYPYLYSGTRDYEERYLETYFRSSRSLVCLVQDGRSCVGASTGILAADEEESFKRPLAAYGLDPETIFYCGESMLLPPFRGYGYGKRFFEAREAYARSLGGVKAMVFCAVVRDAQHPLCPPNYRGPESLWIAQGFRPVEGLQAHYSWRDRGELEETSKPMQYWLKELT